MDTRCLFLRTQCSSYLGSNRPSWRSNRPQEKLNLLHENYPTKSYGIRMYFFILMSHVFFHTDVYGNILHCIYDTYIYYSFL